MQKNQDKMLICDNCYRRLDCDEFPDKNGRCKHYLKDSEIELCDDLNVNPLDTGEFDYDDLKFSLR